MLQKGNPPETAISTMMSVTLSIEDPWEKERRQKSERGPISVRIKLARSLKSRVSLVYAG